MIPDDPFRYGWRYVKEISADGKSVHRQIPLTREDVLHPQVGDCMPQSPMHERNSSTLAMAIRRQVADWPGFIVLHSCRIDWGIESVLPHAPDITVFKGVQNWRVTNEETFQLAKYKAEPVLAIDVTETWSRDLELCERVSEYYRAGVPLYAIVDLGNEEPADGLPRLLCYRAAVGGYELVAQADPLRLWLEPVQLWVALGGRRIACFDKNGQCLADHVSGTREPLEDRQLLHQQIAILEEELRRLRGDTT